MFDEGVSGWSGYELGRSDAKTAAHNAKCMASLRARLRGETILNPLTLANENADLRNILAEKNAYISRLSLYADRVKADLTRHQEWGEGMIQEVARLKERIALLEEKIEFYGI